MPDYIPTNDEKFLVWTQNLHAYALAHAETMKIETTVIMAWLPLLDAYTDALTKAMDPTRGKVDVLRKNQDKAALKTAVRNFIKAYITYNPAVTDVDRESMETPIHDNIRTPVPPPTTVPELDLGTATIRQVDVRFRDQASEHWAKPKGVHGIELRWGLLDTPPTSVEDLHNSAFDTKTPYHFTFDESTRGQALYICPRWENSKGDKGPWGEIVKAIVP
jgi:hypothetical protein